MPEAILWLLLTGEYPNENELEELRVELYQRGRLNECVTKVMESVSS